MYTSQADLYQLFGYVIIGAADHRFASNDSIGSGQYLLVVRSLTLMKQASPRVARSRITGHSTAACPLFLRASSTLNFG